MAPDDPLLAPFPYFGGKRTIIPDVWARFGRPKHYIEPFCGSAAMLLGAPEPCSLEVINDYSGFIANFWRATKHQPDKVAEWADYPVSHIDLGARHQWLSGQRQRLAEALANPHWPGDAQIAGWWLWGQCCWIGSGWCVWDKAAGQVPHISDAGMGIQAAGQVPHISDAGMGIQAAGKVPHISNAGMITSSGRVALQWLRRLADRLERVRIVHGDWDRCLNNHYGDTNTAVFLDPPYVGFEEMYKTAPIAKEVEAWARDNGDLKIALCGHIGDYDLPGWEEFRWTRGGFTYGSAKTREDEAVYFSPACEKVLREAPPPSLFDILEGAA